MSKPFLITGLPRSRTAWMAAAATDGRAVCFHEPMAAMRRWDDVFEQIWHGRGSMQHVGIADHGLGFHLPAIMDRLGPRTLIIERPIAEVNTALARLGLPPTNFCDLLAEHLAFDHPRIRRVGYKDLEDAHEVRRCLEWLMPGQFIDQRRLARYQMLNIQADLGAALMFADKADPAGFFPRDVLKRLTMAVS